MRSASAGMASILAFSVAVALAAGPAAADTVCDTLRAKTQAFSDAGQRGDAATMRALLDDHVIFVNENGERATKADLVDGAQPAPANADVKMTVSDWQCEPHGNAAVTSFIDDQVNDLHGQVVHAQFRSVESWANEHGTWLMIGSQTLALPVDPPAVTLPVAVLEQYVGLYQASPALKAVFALDGTNLTLSVNGGPPQVQRAELRDVLFTPGTPRLRKIFQRDARGGITGFVSRREGHDVVFTRVVAG